MAKRTGRRAFAAIAAVSMMAALPVQAAGAQEESMNLSISKDASYTMTIPKTTNIVEFGAENTEIGDLSVSGDIGTKQKVSVAVSKTDFEDVKDSDNKIEFNLKDAAADFTGAKWNRADALSGKGYKLNVNIPAASWAGKAPGVYQASITFQASLEDITN